MSVRRIWWFLVILFSISTSAGLLIEFFAAGNQKQQIDIPQLERSIQKRQASLNQLLKEFPDSLLEYPKAAWAYMDSVSESDHEMLLFYDNELVAWSDQRLPVQDIHPVFFTQPVIELDNGFFLVQHFRYNAYSLVGLYRLKYSYPYQNKYLHDRYVLPEGLSPSVRIVRDQTSPWQPVFGLEGEYLFSVSDLSLKTNRNSSQTYLLIFYLLSVLSIWGLMFLWLNGRRADRWINFRLLLAVVVFGVFYYFVFWHSGMSAFDGLGLFSPLHFAMSEFLPSLGALLLLVVFLLLTSLLFFRFFRWPDIPFFQSDSIYVKGICFLSGLFLVQMWMFFLMGIVYKLVEHSAEPAVFYKVVELDGIAVVKIVVLAFLFFSFSLIAEKIIRLFLFRLKRLTMSVLILGTMTLAIVLRGGVGYGTGDWSIIFTGIFLLLLALVKRNYRLRHSYNTFIWIITLFALFAGSVLINLSISKEEGTRELLVENLSYQLLREEDPVAEMYLADIEDQILRDAPLRQLLARNNINQMAVQNHLLKYYFYGYWGRYEMQIVPCWPGGNVVFEETGENYNCYQYFFATLGNQGRPIEGSDNFYYLSNDNGRVSYLGVFRFFEGHPLETTLFVELQSKPYFEGLGYPELLVSQKEQNRLALFDGYSYAKYVDGRLVRRSGEYDYHGNYPQLSFDEGQMQMVKDDDYSHVLFKPEPDTLVILSRKDNTVSEVFIAFSVYFILFFLIGLVLIGLSNLGSVSFSLRLSVQKRIQLSFVGLMLLILLVVALGTVFYTVEQYKNKHNELLNDKVQSVLLDLESKIGLEGTLSRGNEEYLNYQLQTISNVFFCDINLYGTDGMLLASSRPEMFEQGLIGGQMNPSAFYRLTHLGENRYLGQETIGDLQFRSYYVPFYNRQDMLMGYINVPYFVANNELREEVSSVVMTVVNFYLLFSFIIIGITVFLSRQITRPLQVLQSKLADLKIDKHNEKIDYQGKDEIGSLVGEYNRMVDELADSASKLARTERELAWREMARQIAHEIKNPLTPMKLNIQYLQRAWNDKVEDFDSYLKRVTGTLIEQIEKLSSIATEFSHFAKMPAARREDVNLIDKIKSSVTLFSNSRDVEIQTDFGGRQQIIVHADGEQLLGVFNNLINNAVQAIPRGLTGLIRISTSVKKNSVLVKIEDNGKGIPEEIREKMFVPNFTTKTSGMGLGLAIVKSTIESAGGKIWFETDTGTGTSFYIELPLASQS
ncbi:ATP-binding protein [Marinilabilia salmonicolor]|uniref:histidine kinase n=1 Tax=Marinilabilia salmonicolor TaxID=989 RepID=A0A368UKS5_9BACT|nr:ATP-binding protein [Marinilabilia salmonicolor]RCW25750.1 phospho-acceptor domain-containing protein [Marinilabilia salmonicolor]